MKFGLKLLVAVLLVFAFYSVFILAKKDQYHHLSALIGFGCLNDSVCLAKLNHKTLPEQAFVYDSGGYDGQFYYYIAYGIYNQIPVFLDHTELRMSRIGMPLLTGWASLIFGARGLVVVMILLPLLFHFLTVFPIIYYYGLSNQGGQRETGAMLPAFIFLLNPISLTCILLALADSLALSLGTISVFLFLIWLRSNARFSLIWPLLVWLLAIMTKETALVLGPFFIVMLGLHYQKTGLLLFLMYLLGPWLVLGGLWQFAHFSPFEFGSVHATAAFSGFWEYLNNPDALFSGRSLFAILIFGIIFTALGTGAIWIKTRSFGDVQMGSMVLLGATLIPTIFASYDEYWLNYANIVRSGIFVVSGLTLLAIKPMQRMRHITAAIVLLFWVWDVWLWKDLSTNSSNQGSIWKKEALEIRPHKSKPKEL